MDTKIVLPAGMEISGSLKPGYGRVLTPAALEFAASLLRQFGPRRAELLAARAVRQKDFDAGKMPDFLPATRSVRDSDWKVADQPKDISGSPRRDHRADDRKMVINALNSGLPRSWRTSRRQLPTWENMVDGTGRTYGTPSPHDHVRAGRQAIQLNEKNGRSSSPAPALALNEKHVTLDGKPVSAGSSTSALYFFHTPVSCSRVAPASYFYLPKWSRTSRRASERHLHGGAEGARRAPRLGQGDGAHRDDRGRLRDGRDPLELRDHSAASTSAAGTTSFPASRSSCSHTGVSASPTARSSP